MLVHCNIVNNDYQHDLRVLYTFISNKSFGQLLDILPKSFIFLKTFDSEFSYIEVRFTDQNSKSLKIEDNINITSVQSRDSIFLNSYGFLGKNICKNIEKNLSGK